MIGGPNNQWCIGAAWILVRSGGVWNQQALLRGEVEGTACDDGPDDGESDELLFGTAVALSADGNVGLVSRPFIDALRLGETWSYARVGSSWTEKTALRDRKGAKAGASSVAVSADGQQVLLGKGEIEGRDSALAFVRAGSEWAQEGWGLLASDRAGFSAFGESVALTSSASTALIGGWADNGNVGAAWVFSKQVLPLPTAVTGVASSVTDASAALNGTVNPNGQEVFNCHFEYGTTTSYGSDTPCSALPGAGESPVEASAPAQGLTANTTYHFRLVAANGGGVAYGADETLTTLPGPPAVVTGAASSITRTAATLNASVNPLGETVSDCHFEYGVSASYGSSVPCSQLPGSGSGAVEVSAPVGSLGEYHPYHFRIVATNPIGTSYGADRTFNTFSNAPEYGRCLEVTPHTGLYANNGCTKWGAGMRYEWHPGAVGVHFTVKLIAGAAAFETVKRSLITCTSETGSGEYTGQKTLGGILLTFAGCEQLGQKCTSLLAAEGELVTNPLEGVLGVIRLGLTSASNKIGLELFPAGKAGAFMEFTCGLTTVTLRGAVIVPVVANKMLTATTLKYSASRGKQHPERFLGEPAAILEASFGNKAYEQTGLTLEATQTSGARWRRTRSPRGGSGESRAREIAAGSHGTMARRADTERADGGARGLSSVAARSYASCTTTGASGRARPFSRLASLLRCWRNRGCRGASSAATGSRTWCAASSEPIRRRRPRASPCGSAAPGRPSAARTRVTSSRRDGHRAAPSPTGHPAAGHPRRA